jgi:RNA polymerase sigma factor (sigma-70 family)
MTDPDLALLDRWIAGDSAAGNLLFKQYFTQLYRFFDNKTDGDIDDLVQETFTACLKGRETFQRQSSFRTYLFAIARYVLLGYWRKRAPGQSSVPVDEISVASLSTSVGSRLGGLEERARLLDALRTLPMDQQALLEMYYWQDLDRGQLAEVFGVETATIGSRLHRARKQLMERLATHAPATDDKLDAWARSFSTAG